MPVQTPVKPVQNTSSPLEISTLQKNLAAHQSAVSQKLATTLEAKIRESLPKIVSGVDQGIISRLAAEIAAESSRDILENIAKINNFNEANTVIADALTQSIVAHPELDGKLKTNEGKIFEGLLKQTADVAQTHQQDLAKAAVLGSMVTIGRLEKPDEQLRSLVIGAVDRAVAARMPLAHPEVNQTLYGNTSGFLQTYVANFNQRVSPQLSQGKIPDFATYQTAKSAAFSEASGEFAKNVKFKGRIDPSDITNRIGFILGLDPQSTQFTTVGQAKGVNAFMMRMMLASNKGQEEFDNALISHDKGWLEKNYARLAAQVEKLKKQRSLTYKDRKAYLLAQKNLQSLGKAMTFRAKNERRAKNWMQLVQTIPAPAGGHNLTLAYQAAITTREASIGNLPGVYAPRSLVGNPLFMARNTLSLLSPKLGLGDLFGSIKASFMAPSLAMGKSFATAGVMRAGIVGATGNLMNRLAKGLAALWGGMLLYMMMLGKAALVGFLIGSAAGATAGALAGAIIPVAMFGPAGILLWPVTIPLGMAAGGVVGGITGALIGYGLASGSTTAVAMGVGAGVGGTVGAIAGGIIGAALAGALVTLIGAIPIIGPILAPILAPVLIPLGTMLGVSVGAIVGTAVGAAIGYVIGHYVIGTIGVPASGALAGAAIGFYFGGPPGAVVGAGIGWLVAGGWSQVKDFFTGAAGTGAGVISGFGSLVTGLASTVWGGIATGVTGAFGAISGATSFLVGGLGSLSIPTFVIAVPVFGGLGAITIGSIIVGITTATSFFSTDKEIGPPTGENQFAKIEKQVSAAGQGPSTFISFGNDKLPTTLKFDVKVTAKTDISNITCSDKATLAKKNSPPENLTLPAIPTCPLTMAAGEPFNFSFDILATTSTPNFNDSLVVNTFTFGADGAGDPPTPFVLAVSASVAIGDAPMDCPRGWPTEHGWINQGPNGTVTHQGIQGIDIHGNGQGTPVYATHPGTAYTSIRANGSKDIEIVGTCNGETFSSFTTHFLSFDVTDGQEVKRGDIIGRVDCTGNCISDHVHYQFGWPNIFHLPMAPPYIPEEIPEGCVGRDACGNIEW